MFKSRFAREMHAFSSLTLDSLSIQPRLEIQKCFYLTPIFPQITDKPPPQPHFLQTKSNK